MPRCAYDWKSTAAPHVVFHVVVAKISQFRGCDDDRELKSELWKKLKIESVQNHLQPELPHRPRRYDHDAMNGTQI